MLLFEIVFRLLAALAVFPACKWLFNGALRITGLNCLTADNLPQVLTNPLMLLCFALLFVAFSLTAMLEVSCLITCLDAAPDAGEPLDVLRTLREGLRDTLRLLRPRNWPLLLITAFLIPLTYLPSNASPLRLINLPWRKLGQLALQFPYILAPLAYFALVLFLAGTGMCAYQRYVLEDCPAPAAIRGAQRLNRGRRLARLGQLIIWMVAAVGGTLIAVRIASFAFDRLTGWIVSDLNLRYRILLPLTTILNFLRSSVPATAGYAFLNATYAVALRDAGEALPQRRVAPEANARRRNALLFYAVALLCVVGLALYDTQIRPLLVRMNALEYVSGHPTLVIAHRGYSAEADENTLAAFQAAIALGVDYVELDVQQTADGVVIVNHDKTFHRVYGVNRRTWETTYSELQRFSAPVTGECPPTLEEVLTRCDPQANLLIELKYNGHNPDLVRAVYDLLAERDCLGRCAIQSSSYRLIREFKELAPDVRCGYILSFALGSYAHLSAADFFSLDYDIVNERVIDDIHGAGKDLYVWTLNDERQITEMARLGADGVITDDTPLAKTLLLENSAAAPLDELIVEPLEQALSGEEGEGAPEEGAQEEADAPGEP